MHWELGWAHSVGTDSCPGENKSEQTALQETGTLLTPHMQHEAASSRCSDHIEIERGKEREAGSLWDRIRVAAVFSAVLQKDFATS